jgi:hypothetical protein
MAIEVRKDYRQTFSFKHHTCSKQKPYFVAMQKIYSYMGA